MFNFLHTYHPEPIVFSFGPLQVHWYGLLMVIGGLLGFALILKLADYYKLNKKFFHNLLIYWVVGAVLGARIYYVIYAWELYRDDWSSVFHIWQGGLAIHGIMLGGFVTTYIYAKLKKRDFWLVADLIAVGLVAAQVIGRIGNYFNQEIFGRPTSSAWGIPIDVINRPAGFLEFEFFHPTFLYESFGNLIILGILLGLTYWRFKRKTWQAGNIFLFYLVFYSIQRIILEFYRLDFSPIVFGLRWAQLFSSIVAIVCFILLIYRGIKSHLEKK